MSDLIGPLTAEEWCAFRLRNDNDDLLRCCADTSAFRDVLFEVLRNGAGPECVHYLAEPWSDMLNHPMPGGEAVPLLKKIREYYGLPKDPS